MFGVTVLYVELWEMQRLPCRCIRHDGNIIILNMYNDVKMEKEIELMF